MWRYVFPKQLSACHVFPSVLVSSSAPSLCFVVHLSCVLILCSQYTCVWLLVCGCVHTCVHMCVSVDKMLHFINTLILLLLFYVTVICDITDYPLKVPFFSLVCVCACVHACVRLCRQEFVLYKYFNSSSFILCHCQCHHI